MNYRHAFHAGSFADVFKHAILARVIEYLKRKDGAFRIHDTHAGPRQLARLQWRLPGVAQTLSEMR